jgi:hypothetical protein
MSHEAQKYNISINSPQVQHFCFLLLIETAGFGVRGQVEHYVLKPRGKYELENERELQRRLK